MANFPSAGPFNPQDPLVLESGIVTPSQSRWFLGLSGPLAQIQTVVNNSLGTNFLTLASQPSLGAGDTGYVMFVTDYAHLVYWDGAAWQWMDGDRPGRFDDFAAAPGTGWALCDGSATTFLVVGGATLTTSAFTTPDRVGTPNYLKSAAAYTGVINAKGGSTGTGTTGTKSTTLSGNTDAESGTQTVQAGAGATVPAAPHTHGTSLIIAVAHDHSVPALDVGSIEMANLATLPYVRR